LLLADLKVKEDRHVVDHLSKLKDLSVDLTGYLTAQQAPQVTEEVQVVTGQAPTNTQF